MAPDRHLPDPRESRTHRVKRPGYMSDGVIDVWAMDCVRCGKPIAYNRTTQRYRHGEPRGWVRYAVLPD